VNLSLSGKEFLATKPQFRPEKSGSELEGSQSILKNDFACLKDYDMEREAIFPRK
jgi:hypothetical protein